MKVKSIVVPLRPRRLVPALLCTASLADVATVWVYAGWFVALVVLVTQVAWAVHAQTGRIQAMVSARWLHALLPAEWANDQAAEIELFPAPTVAQMGTTRPMRVGTGGKSR